MCVWSRDTGQPVERDRDVPTLEPQVVSRCTSHTAGPRGQERAPDIRRQTLLSSPLSPSSERRRDGSDESWAREGREPGAGGCAHTAFHSCPLPLLTNSHRDKQPQGQTTTGSSSPAVQDQHLCLGLGKHNSEGIKSREMPVN